MPNTDDGNADSSETSSEHAQFVSDVFAGLSKRQKTIPCRWLYDAKGSELFEDITRVGDYYPTRTEESILRTAVHDIAARTTPGTVLVEYGSGSSRKTEALIEALGDLAGYVPIDVSDAALDEACERLSARFPKLVIEPLVADFSTLSSLPAVARNAPARLGFFPGSTIGNLDPKSATQLLAAFHSQLSPKARLVLGIDLQKDPAILERAYDDSDGVTAAFNLNLLDRMNRELDATFEREMFQHDARFNPTDSRVEMHLVAKAAHTVKIAGRVFEFDRNETIHTENSYKYSIDGFRALAKAAGWTAEKVWTDDNDLFSVHELT